MDSFVDQHVFKKYGSDLRETYFNMMPVQEGKPVRSVEGRLKLFKQAAFPCLDEDTQLLRPFSLPAGDTGKQSACLRG